VSDAPRRIVTGHDASGRSVVLSDGPVPISRAISDGATFHELWATAAAPAPIAATEPEPNTAGAQRLGPPPQGTRVRVVDMPPGTRSPMHRTETVDYGIVAAGRVHLVLDDTELECHAGDVIIQRGTSHAWENRSAHDARVIFVLVDGEPTAELRAALPDAGDTLMDSMP
jgi:quercetin dioxygenase-like cupin family protein